MKKPWLARSLGEFTVIVVGVLVALAVDDLRQYQADRQLESDLLERLESDLRSDAADLALARTGMLRRTWVLEAVLVDLDDGIADGHPLHPVPDSLVEPTSTIALLEAVGRSISTRIWDPVQDPLRTFELYPEFDISDDSFQEMLSAGGLQVIRDNPLRSEILRYYRSARDMGENERREAAYEPRLEQALAEIGIVLSDDLTLQELTGAIAGRPDLQVELRRALRGLDRQALFYGFIESARQRLEAALADSGVAAS